MEEAWELAALDMASRWIPKNIRSRLLQEAGYRCGIPTCNVTSALTFEHIEDWAKLEIKEHDFDKMIVLCSNCHHRVTHTKDIPKAAIQSYKRNLQVVNARYSLFEMRLLRKIRYGNNVTIESIVIFATDADLLHLAGFIEDNFLRVQKIPNGTQAKVKMQNRTEYLVLPTNKGLKFAEKYFSGEEIE